MPAFVISPQVHWHGRSQFSFSWLFGRRLGGKNYSVALRKLKRSSASNQSKVVVFSGFSPRR